MPGPKLLEHGLTENSIRMGPSEVCGPNTSNSYGNTGQNLSESTGGYAACAAGAGAAPLRGNLWARVQHAWRHCVSPLARRLRLSPSILIHLHRCQGPPQGPPQGLTGRLARQRVGSGNQPHTCCVRLSHTQAENINHPAQAVHPWGFLQFAGEQDGRGLWWAAGWLGAARRLLCVAWRGVAWRGSWVSRRVPCKPLSLPAPCTLSPTLPSRPQKLRPPQAVSSAARRPGSSSSSSSSFGALPGQPATSAGHRPGYTPLKQGAG
jgi:hypothetical protein